MKFIEQHKNYIKSAFLLIFFALVINLILSSEAHAAVTRIEPAFSVLKDTNQGMGAAIKKAWESSMKFVDGVLILALLAVAFSQILRININTYGFKKMLPTLILAVIGAHFSFLICRLMVDFSNLAIAAITDNGKMSPLQIVDSEAFSAEKLNVGTYASKGDIGPVIAFCFAQLLLFAAGIMELILAFLFFIRLWMIYLLTGLSSLAFLAMALPQTKQYFNQWWSNFAKWVFMPVSSVFLIWLGSQWIGIIGDKNGSGGLYVTFLFAGVFYYLAITTPFKLGGAVMSAWGNLGKKAWGKTGGAATAWAGREAKERGIDAGIKAMSWMKNDTKAGKFLDKTIGKRYRNLRDRNVSARQERLLRAEGPSMVKKKREEDARVNAAGRLADDPNTDSAARSRYRALQRAWVLDEMKSGEWQDATVDEVDAKVLRNTNGTIVTPWNDPDNQLSKNYTEGHGRQMAAINTVKKIRRTSRDKIERDKADNLLKGYNTPSMDGSGKMINFLAMDTHGYGTSIIEREMNLPSGVDGTSNHISTINALGGEGILTAALSGDSKAIQEKINETKGKLNPEQQRELDESIKEFQSGISSWAVNELKQRQKQFNESTGIGLKALVDNGQHLNFSSSDALIKSVDSHNFSTDIKANSQVKEHVKEAIGKMELSGFKISPNLNMAEASRQFAVTTSAQMKNDVRNEAKAEIGTQIAMTRMAKNPNMSEIPVSSLHGDPEAIALLQDIKNSINKGGSQSSVDRITHGGGIDAMADRAVIQSALQGLSKDIGISVGKALSNTDTRNALKDSFKRALVDSKTTVTTKTPQTPTK